MRTSDLRTTALRPTPHPAAPATGTPRPDQRRPDPLPPDDLRPEHVATLRAQLEQQARFRLDQLDDLRATDPDHASEVTVLLTVGARAALHDVLGALARMDAGTYGICTDCGVRMPHERLEVLPQVAQCLTCRRAAEDR